MVRLALIGTKDDAAKYARLIARIGKARLAALAVRGVSAAHSADANGEIVADSLASLLAQHAAQFDAVIILGDPRDCLDDCRRAAEAGKHLLLQRLLALSPSDIAALNSACAIAGVRLMAGDSIRFHPHAQAIWKSKSSGQLGEPGLLRMHFWEPGGTNSPGKLTAAIDLAIWLFGQPPSHVYSTARSEVVGQGIGNRQAAASEYEYVQAHLGFDGGGMALVDHTRALPPGDGYFSIAFIGSKGAAYADDQHYAQLLYRGGPPTAIRADFADGQSIGALREFVAAIEENRQPVASGADVLHAIHAVDAAAESLATGRAIGCAYQSETLAGVR